ncbi:hypothetical protein PIB30_077650, partial [Stylosanthes scabra]|nr:hypothetical protein [Stylosanthes scabra]
CSPRDGETENVRGGGYTAEEVASVMWMSEGEIAECEKGAKELGISRVGAAEALANNVGKESELCKAMANKGKMQVVDSGDENTKKQAGDSGNKNTTSAEASGLDDVRDIPKMNLEDLAGHDNPMVAVFNTFREHLLERDSRKWAMGQANRKQLKLLTDAITGQGRLVNLMWSEHCELQKAFQEKRELTKKAILYSIDRSGGYAIPDSQPTIREELLRSYGVKNKEREAATTDTTAAKRQHSTAQLKRRLDFDQSVVDEVNKVASAGEGSPDNIGEVAGVKYGYIGSAHFPVRLKVSFRPPPGMQFLITEIACGAYIFSKSKDKRYRRQN